MARPAGLPKTGGRKKGTPNKRTLHLAERCEERGFDPVEELMALLPALKPERKAEVLLSLLPYLYPKRKPAEEMEVEEEFELEFTNSDESES